MKKRLLKLTVAVAAVILLTAALFVVASAGTYSGSCGDNGNNVTYTLDTETGVLKIEGEGMMKFFNSVAYVPWHSYISYINTVVIGNGVTSIGPYAFSDCSNLTNIEIPDSVTNIGNDAFYGTAYYNNSSNWENGIVLYIGNHLIEAKNTISGDYVIKDNTLTIGECAFYGCADLASVVIPDSMTRIDWGAFDDCNNLKNLYISDLGSWLNVSLSSGSHPLSSSGGDLYIDGVLATNIVIPDSVTSIGYEAFKGCSSLISVIIPDSVTSIGQYAFRYCSSLTSITIPDSVTSIGYEAFGSCGNLKNMYISDLESWLNVSLSYGSHPLSFSGGDLYIDGVLATNIVIPGSVTSIGGYAFYGCSSLTSVEIPDNITSIGYRTFDSCSSLTSIDIPNSVTSIGQYAFSGCTGLTGINIPDSVTSIGAGMFRGCSSLTNVIIPDSVTSIGDAAFYECSSLISIEIPDSVTSIGEFAFQGCNSLTNVKIGNSVTSIGAWAFTSCRNLKNMYISDLESWLNVSLSAASHPFYSSSGNLYIDGVLATDIVIPDSVTNIGRWTLHGCSSLTSVEIPDSVTSIGGYAFERCSSLTSVVIPDSVTNIGNDAFYGTAYYNNSSNWENGIVLYIGNHLIEAKNTISGEYVIKDNTLTIGECAFYGCADLASVVIPDSVTSIGDAAFKYCSSLTSITIPGSVTSIGYEVFYDTAYYNNSSNWENGLVLYISNHLIEAKTTIISGDYTIKDSTLTIANGAFSSCNNLKSVSIPNSVTSIGDYAFKYCSSLTNITIPNSVTSIEEDSFYGCSGLRSVTIPNSVMSIGSSAFSSCRNLISITIPNSVISIGDYAFNCCSSLTSITIPISVTGIGVYAFGDCSSLKSAVFLTKIAEISPTAFYNCENLKTIRLYPNSTADEYFKENDDYTIKYLSVLENEEGVSIIGEAGVDYPENTEIIVEVVDDEMGDIVIEGHSDKICALDITLVSNGVETQPNSTIFVRIKVPEGFNGKKCKVYHRTDDGQLVDMDAVYEDGYLVFATDHFSVYVVAELLAADSGDLNGDGEINAVDAVLLAQKIAGWDVELDETAADCNGDGEINSIDAVLLAQYIAGWDVTLG